MCKRMGMSLMKNRILRCWDCLSLPNWIGAFALSLFIKLHPRELESSFIPLNLFLPRLHVISINLLYSRECNTSCHGGAGAPSCNLNVFD